MNEINQCQDCHTSDIEILPRSASQLLYEIGFKDCCHHMIDRFVGSCRCDPGGHRHPPIDTAMIRRMLEQLPPGAMVQNLVEPTPSDLHYTTDSETYDSGADTILSPFSIRPIPTGYPGGGR